MSWLIDLANQLKELALIVPLWAWQILGAVILTMALVQIVKQLEPITWTPERRRKTNLGISMLMGAGITIWIYDQSAKDFVVAAVMAGNNFLYTGLAKLIRNKAEQHNGFWTILHGFVRPHTRKVVQNGIVKEKDLDTDETVIMRALTENEALDRLSEVPRE